MLAFVVSMGLGVALEPLRPAAAPLRPASAPTLAAAELGARYRCFAADHFVPLAACQMGMVRGAADLVAQQHAMYHDALDISHAAVMATVGFFVSGCGGALWLRYLERKLGPCDGPGSVLAKSGADFLCFGPMVNTANLVLVPLLLGQGLAASVLNASTGLPSIMLLELCIFGPYNIIGFSMITPELRPTIKAVLSFIFSVGLSLAMS
uniref:Uncharacterized protein n=1 Tax=Prymnesium polylepis TaxID=72548 RepID=A0A6V4M0M4_9EUKA|mmetsp:Transcript_19725/g.53255  ORF Transcript_19725/g.53255 Transcript_19725/m.53255 type:complete len:208 (-) Transcript_19725:270-893(-)